MQTLASQIVRSRPTRWSAKEENGGDEQDAKLHETLTRWGMNPEAWLAQLHRLDRQCTRALGTVERVLERARGAAQQRFHGVSLCRALFAAATSDAFT